MCAENVKRIHSKIGFVTIPVLLLAATVAISVIVSEDAFAKNGRYTGDTSQAAAASNDCLNPIFDSNEGIDNAVGIGNRAAGENRGCQVKDNAYYNSKPEFRSSCKECLLCNSKLQGTIIWTPIGIGTSIWI